MTLVSRISWSIIVAATLSAGSAAAGGKVVKVSVAELSERAKEVAIAVKATVTGLDAETLQRCISRQVDRPLPLKGDPQQIFQPSTWSAEEKRILLGCDDSTCKYELPGWGIQRLMQTKGLEPKQRVYFDVLHQMTVNARKERKPGRIRLRDVRREPCAGTGALRWLLNSKLGSATRLAWRKMSGDERMRPTIITFQVHSWEVGEIRCVGRTMLAADHYYDDHLELVTIEPAGGDRLDVRFLLRSRFAFIDTWWERKTVKWGIRNASKKHSRNELERWIRSCN